MAPSGANVSGRLPGRSWNPSRLSKVSPGALFPMTCPGKMIVDNTQSRTSILWIRSNSPLRGIMYAIHWTILTDLNHPVDMDPGPRSPIGRRSSRHQDPAELEFSQVATESNEEVTERHEVNVQGEVYFRRATHILEKMFKVTT